MRRILLAAAAVLTYLAVSVLPAQAGAGYWSVTDCRTFNGWPQARLDISWYSRSSPYAPYGPQTLYWLDGWSNVHSYSIVENFGSWKGADFYAAGGYQCNTPGAPLENKHSCPGVPPYGIPNVIGDQNFEGGRIWQSYNGQMHYAFGNHNYCQYV